MASIQLTKHEEETFESQTILLSGHGFIKCKFNRCTLILTNSPVIINDCRFENCNWRLEYDILWGDPGNLKNLRQFLEFIERGSAKEFSSMVH